MQMVAYNSIHVSFVQPDNFKDGHATLHACCMHDTVQGLQAHLRSPEFNCRSKAIMELRHADDGVQLKSVLSA